VDLAASRKTCLSGIETGNVPVGFSRDFLSRPQLWLLGIVWWLIDHIFTADTRLGRKLREVDRRRASPLIRQSPAKIISARVERMPRVEGVVDGKPLLADGRALEVASVVWATGYKPDFGWIELPVFGDDGFPIHYRGVVSVAPGLYFLGLPFQYTITSAFIGGVVKDARYISDHIAGRRVTKEQE
jgi:putative flavoprotein involved in K+ transport